MDTELTRKRTNEWVAKLIDDIIKTNKLTKVQIADKLRISRTRVYHFAQAKSDIPIRLDHLLILLDIAGKDYKEALQELDDYVRKGHSSLREKTNQKNKVFSKEFWEEFYKICQDEGEDIVKMSITAGLASTYLYRRNPLRFSSNAFDAVTVAQYEANHNRKGIWDALYEELRKVSRI